MKKFLTLLTMLVFVAASLAIAFAQPRRRKSSTNVNRRVSTSNVNRPRSAIGAGGAGLYARGRRGRYVTRNGKRIWVPQGSPRRVYEREQDAEVRSPASNTNRP